MNKHHRITGFALLLLLAGCKDLTHVQTGYVADRDECRTQSQQKLGLYEDADDHSLNNKEESNALLQLFCECMGERDWKTGGCPKLVEVAKVPPQTVIVVQQPPAATVAAEPPPEPCIPPKPGQKTVLRKRHGKINACAAPDSITPQMTPTPQQTDTQLNSVLQRQ